MDTVYMVCNKPGGMTEIAVKHFQVKCSIFATWNILRTGRTAQQREGIFRRKQSVCMLATVATESISCVYELCGGTQGSRHHSLGAKKSSPFVLRRSDPSPIPYPDP